MKLINILALVVATVTATVPEFKKIEGSSLTDLRARETEVLMCSETNYRFCELFDASPAGTCYVRTHRPHCWSDPHFGI